MEQEKNKKESSQEAPGLREIAEEIKELGSRIKEVLVSAAQSEKAQKLKKQVLDNFDMLMEKAGNVIDDVKSGQMEKDAKKSLHQSLKKVNEKLKEYSESVGKEEEEPGEEKKEENKEQ